MVPSEKLAALGFPVTGDQAEALSVTPLPLLDPHRGDSYVGNAMHFSNCAIMFLLGVSCFGPVTSSHEKVNWPSSVA